MKRYLAVGFALLACATSPSASQRLRDLSDESQTPTTPVPPLNTSATVTAPSPSPSAVAKKQELCQKDFNGYNKVLRLMTVSPKRQLQIQATHETTQPPHKATKYPRIFCYVGTISSYHKNHAQLVADTWAQRCDKTVFFSNDTGTMVVNNGTEFQIEFEIIKMNAPADYRHLWLKHREVLQYMHDHYRHDYDWFYKADDDAYLVVDNLREYLRRPEILMNYKRQPMQLGGRYKLSAGDAEGSIQNKEIKSRWHKSYDRWVFNGGGPGYAMNRLFLDKFVASMQDKTCLSEPWAETAPEDTGTSYCMMWHGVVPWDTSDVRGRPRWHQLSPPDEYRMSPQVATAGWREFQNGLGGLKWGDNCCAPDSVGFHYIKGQAMYHMERMLYYCRDEDTFDIATFNRKYGLAISDKVLIPPGK